MKPERVTGMVGEVSSNKEVSNELNFNFKLGARCRSTRNRFFIQLSSAQVAALREYKRRFKATNGFARVEVHPNKLLQWTAFYPYGELPDKYYLSPESREEVALRRKGVGTLTHHAIAKYLAKKFPSHRITHEIVVPEREKHLLAIGINPNKIYPIKEYHDIMRRYVRKKFGKAVVKRFSAEPKLEMP